MVEVFEPGKVAIICDSAWGSSAKGLCSHYLANNYKGEFSFAISQTTRNASHTIVLPDGKECKFVHLPISGVLNEDTDIIIGADATIELEVLFKEIEDWKHKGVRKRLFIHPNAAVITEEDKELEQRECRRIASTMTGTAGAKIRKILRNGEATLAKDILELKDFVSDVYEVIIEHLKQGHSGLLEGSQGFDLSVDHGGVYKNMLGFYPYTTSRNADPLSFVASSGIPKSAIGKIIAVVRTFPIRVGDGTNCKVDGLSGVSLEGAYSGGYYPDQIELTWEQITKMAESPVPIYEQTSLTKRPRRVFTFSKIQWKHFTRICQPDYFFVTFVNYLDWSLYGKGGKVKLDDLPEKVRNFVHDLEVFQYWYDTPYAGKTVWLSTSPSPDQTLIL